MRVCAISDLHGKLPNPTDIPACQVLIISGDLCPDIPFHQALNDPELMRLRQMDWLRTTYSAWEKHVPASHIIMTPGNHDWVTYLPENCRTVFLVDEDFVLNARRFWCTPWSEPYGDFNWQASPERRREAFAMIPMDVSVIIAHAPPKGILDTTYYGIQAGCPEFLAICKARHARHVTFGHIHEGKRFGASKFIDGTYYHNVAQTYVEFDL